MEVEFLHKFSKDIDKIGVKAVKQSLIKLIEQIESEKDLNEIAHLKKLVGHKSASEFD